MYLSSSLPMYWASENEKLLAQQENLLVRDNGTALFLSPDMSFSSGRVTIY